MRLCLRCAVHTRDLLLSVDTHRHEDNRCRDQETDDRAITQRRVARGSC
jgi:hypothetical protein